ncbi:MAG: hypothetical protein ACI35S_05950 [Anaeroplasma sp.]
MLMFFDSEEQKGIASLYESHITFNKTMLKYFSETYRVRVGIEKDDKKIYVFLINKDYALSGEIKESSLLPISVSKTYARVCSRAMMDYICDIFNLNIPKKEYLRFNTTYDEVKKAIVIDMKGEIS